MSVTATLPRGLEWSGFYYLVLVVDADQTQAESTYANNLLDEDPILDAVNGSPVDEYLYPQVGRVYFARYSIEF